MGVQVEIVGSFVDGISGALSNIAGVAFDAFKDVVNSASESEQAVARLDGVLAATGGAAGLTSEQLQQMANSLQNTTRFSDETILAGESLLLTFRNISGETFERTVPAMLDMAEIFGSVDSAAMQLGKALNDPIAGMGALSRAGITFSEEQKETIKHFVETNDLASAQAIILSEVEAQVSGLAEKMGGTFAGQIEIAKNKLDSFKESVGTTALILGKDLLGSLLDFSEGSALTDVGTFFDILNSRLENGVPLIQSFGMALLDIGNHSENIASGALDHLGYSIINLQKAIDESGMFSPEFWEAAREVISNFGRDTGLDLSFSGIAEAFEGWVDSVDWEVVSQKIAAGIRSVDWGMVGNEIAEGLGYIAIAIGDVLGEIDWPDLLGSVGMAIADFISGLFGFVDWDDMISSAAAGFRYVGESIVDGFSAGLEQAWENVKSFPAVAFNNFINAAKAIFGISSPSTVFTQIGRDIVNGLIGGFLAMWDTFISIASDSIDAFLSMFGIDLSSGGSLGTHDTGDTHTRTGGSTGTTGGGTGTGAPGGAAVYNFYGPVYFNGVGDIQFDCPSPHPLLASSQTLAQQGF